MTGKAYCDHQFPTVTATVPAPTVRRIITQEVLSLVLLYAICPFISVVPMANAGTVSPPSGFDLTKLQKFYDSKGENPEKAIVELVSYLREEIIHPSQPEMGIGGGPIDTVYIQDVIITVMAQTVPQQTLLQAYSQEKDNNIKTRLMLALVTAGDSTFLKDVQALLSVSDDNLIRLAATKALRPLRKPLEALLLTMKDDTYSRIAFRDGSFIKVYPIRQSAHDTLVQANVTTQGWKVEMPLTAKTTMEALATVLDDENIYQSVAILQVIRKSYPGEEAVQIAKKFIETNGNKSRMIPAIQEAQEIINNFKNR